MLMFVFELAPVEEIQPWKGTDGPTLSWFGLSYGSYCIQVEGHRLLEYATGVERVTYQVARLHEDVLEMLPDVLDAVPESVVAHFRDGSLLATRDALLAIANERPLEDPLWDALEGFRSRCLDTLYLRPGANVALWRRRDEVVIEWDNRSYRIAGAPAWSATQGRVSVSMERFKASVTDFHERFLAAMRDRIADVTFHWSRAEVRVDPAGLIDAQRQAETVLTNALALRPRRAIPWEVMTACLRNEGAG